MVQTVLVIEDDEIQRDFLAEVLRARGYEVLTRESAEDLMATVRLTPPDAVLLDYQLPGVDGLTALRRLRHARENVPVIMVTTVSDQNLAVQCFRAGATDFVAKPVDPDYLEIVVRRAIEHASGNLRDMALSLLRYVRHQDDCASHDNSPCTCGMTETVRAVSSMVKASS